MKYRLYMNPKYLRDGFAAFFMGLPRILLFTLLAIAVSLPIVTIGPAFIALNCCLRRLASDDIPDVKYYFDCFKAKFKCGLLYSAILVLVLLSLSLNYREHPVLLLAGIAGLFLFIYTLYYPVVAFGCDKNSQILKLSAAYFISHMLQTLMMVSLFYIFMLLVALLSELLFLLVYPICYFMINRIVVANNREIDEARQREEELRQTKLSIHQKGEEL